jgi:hypothetical protein
MPPRTTSKKKIMATGRVSRKPRKPLTYGKTREMLHKLDEWWEKLDKAGEEIAKLIRNQPADQPLPAALKRRVDSLAKKISREGHYPMVHGICHLAKLASKGRPPHK